MSTKRTADAARWTAVAMGIALTSIVMGIALMAFVGTEPRLTTPKPAIVHLKEQPPKDNQPFNWEEFFEQQHLEQRRDETILVVIASLQIAAGALLLAFSITPRRETHT